MIPFKVETSGIATVHEDFLPQNSIDLDYRTLAMAVSDSSEEFWFKLSFSELNCVKEIQWQDRANSYWLKWTCTDQGCLACEGEGCTDADLIIGAEVTIEGPRNPDTVARVPNCHYGDRVMIRGKSDHDVYVAEFVVTHGEGYKFFRINYCLVCTFAISKILQIAGSSDRVLV